MYAFLYIRMRNAYLIAEHQVNAINILEPLKLSAHPLTNVQFI